MKTEVKYLKEAKLSKGNLTPIPYYNETSISNL